VSEENEIHGGHLLFQTLRNGMLWHCTSPQEFFQMQDDGYMKPNREKTGKYGNQRSACQELDAVSLFDFTTRSEDQVLGTADRWQQFLGCAKPLTILIGLSPEKVPGKLIYYPENRDRTSQKSSGPIPWVEVCHCGPIPTSGFASYLLVCAANYNRFRKVEMLTREMISRAESECGESARLANEASHKLFSKITNTPEFRARLEEANRRVEEIEQREMS
jgi:hypothetical protein